ncbi:MAG: hypothetical protein LBU66_06950, partial [Treponema sp.]|nr:hypothetical protein [Treponema sp.]
MMFFAIPLLNAQEIDDAEEPATEINLEELRQRITGEAPGELMSFSLGDAGVSLFLTGSWKGTLQGNLGFSDSPLGQGAYSPETPLLFMQEVDLGMSLWINDRWFVEANFLDDSALNTYRAGYQGLSGEFLQYAGIGNTGLDFPSFPYLDLGGDSPSSFGFYSRMGSSNLKFHTLFRFDAASREERHFTGNRERTYSYVQPQNSISGISFVLPDDNIDSEIIVYIEDEKGGLRDATGRRWRLALSSEYAAGRMQGLLELSVRPSGMVAVSYSKGGSRPWLLSMGSYDGAGFLSDVQNWFDPSRMIKLEEYTQAGNGRGTGARPGEVIFGNVHALVVREPGTFSPFERQNRYEAPSGYSEQAALVSLSSGTQVSGYELVPLEENAAAADIPLYIHVVTQRGIYELLPSGGFSQRDPQMYLPLAREYPEIYLPVNARFTGDIVLRFTNFSGTGGYNIGTDAVPGSVQVWRSGIQYTNFTYNPSSGEVVIHGSVGQNELIRITYLKQSEETRLGSIAAGAGLIYQNEADTFSAQAVVGIRWNITEESAYTEEGLSSAGTVGLSAKTAWDYDFLKAHVSAGLALEQTDTTGLYRAAGMEGNETVLSLPPESSFLSQPPSTVDGLNTGNRADLVFRNYYNNTLFDSTLMPIDWNAPLVSGLNMPYPVKDPKLGGAQMLAAEFSLNNSEFWTGFEVPVFNYADILSRAGEIEIPYRLYDFSGDITNFSLIIQIGALSGKDFAINENPDLIWEEELFKQDEIIGDSPRIARFSLNDENR